MKKQKTFLLFLFFSLSSAPFFIGIFNDSPGGISAMWDLPSIIISCLVAFLLYLMAFSGTSECNKDLYIYKLTWLQEIFLISGITGTAIGFYFGLNSMDSVIIPEVDPTASLVSSMAVAMLTMIYGFIGALAIYLVQKYHELKNADLDSVEVIKPKEGFLLYSLLCLIIIIVLRVLTLILMGSYAGDEFSDLYTGESLIYIITLSLIFILFYKGNSIINLIKNIFWYIPDTEKNINYNLNFIRNMKTIAAIFVCVSLLAAPLVILVSWALPPENNNLGWNSLPFIGIKNGAQQLMYILNIILLLNVIEGREVAKLYFETGKINTGDRFYSIKYILAPAFLLFFTFSFGIMLSFII